LQQAAALRVSLFKKLGKISWRTEKGNLHDLLALVWYTFIKISKITIYSNVGNHLLKKRVLII